MREMRCNNCNKHGVKHTLLKSVQTEHGPRIMGGSTLCDPCFSALKKAGVKMSTAVVK